MGKERFVGSIKGRAKATMEFANTKPKTTLLGIVSLGGAINGSVLGLSVVNGNETSIIVSSVALGIEAGIAALTLKKSKNSRSDNRQ